MPLFLYSLSHISAKSHVQVVVLTDLHPTEFGGAEPIRGELLKVGITVSKRTVQKYMRSVRGRRGGGQTWATFVKNHADDIWCCDFVQTYDLLIRPLFLFFLLNQGSRKVVHIAATRNPTQE